MAHSTDKQQVVQMKNGRDLAEYASIEEAAGCSDASRSGISKCCRGLDQTAGGFGWRYGRYGDNDGAV